MDMDERLKKDVGVDRRSREVDERSVVENRDLSDDDRLEMFRHQMFNDALPNLPDIPGYHVCWLTTTNSRDPIHRRMMLGYEPIKASEIPGMDYVSVKTGEWAGCIGVNEMLAFKLPLKLYNGYMREAHYDAPMREEVKLAEAAKDLQQQAEAIGGKITLGDGMEELGRHVPPPGGFE